MKREAKQEPPVLKIRVFIDGKVIEAEVPGGLVAMKGGRK